MKGVTGCGSVRSVRMDGQPSPMNVTTVFLRIRGSVKTVSKARQILGGTRGADESWASHPQYYPWLTRPNSIVLYNTGFILLLPQAPPMVLHYRVHGAS